MSPVLWVIIAIVVVALVVGIAAAVTRQRSQRLRGTFGPEYDRTVDAQRGDRIAAERDLSGRVSRRKELNIVPLPEAARQRYATSWQQVQARFVYAPAESLAEADRLVNQVMRDRGYPMGEFEQRAADISVDHPRVVDNYRGAHSVHARGVNGQAT